MRIGTIVVTEIPNSPAEYLTVIDVRKVSTSEQILFPMTHAPFRTVFVVASYKLSAPVLLVVGYLSLLTITLAGVLGLLTDVTLAGVLGPLTIALAGVLSLLTVSVAVEVGLLTRVTSVALGVRFVWTCEVLRLLIDRARLSPVTVVNCCAARRRVSSF